MEPTSSLAFRMVLRGTGRQAHIANVFRSSPGPKSQPFKIQASVLHLSLPLSFLAWRERPLEIPSPTSTYAMPGELHSGAQSWFLHSPDLRELGPGAAPQCME